MRLSRLSRGTCSPEILGRMRLLVRYRILVSERTGKRRDGMEGWRGATLLFCIYLAKPFQALSVSNVRNNCQFQASGTTVHFERQRQRSVSNVRDL